jgi:16S rRNA (cytosine967-C5)-methyltransferase
MSGPRNTAVWALNAVLEDGAYSDTILDILLERDRTLTVEDRALATEITYGTLRNLGRIDWVLARFSKRSLPSLDADVLNILRSALYQILFLQKVPSYAVVDEAVKLAAILGKKSSGSFVNGVLRSALRGMEAIDYPSPKKDPLGFLLACYSVPRWLGKLLIDRLGITGATVVASRYTERAPVVLRTNATKIARQELISRLSAQGHAVSQTRFSPFGVLFRGGGAIFKYEAFRDGLFSVQDEASQLSPIALGVGPGMAVLDVCAAPGIKGTFCAELMGDDGSVLSVEVNEGRARKIPENARRLGIRSLRVVAADIARAPLIPDARFDRVLVDPPCSALGIIRRSPEIKWRVAPGDLPVLVKKQRKILESSAEFLKTGGALVYSVCTINPDEGIGVVRDFLCAHPEFKLDDVTPFVGEACAPLVTDGAVFSTPDRLAQDDPDIPDGFFIARLVKS